MADDDKQVLNKDKQNVMWGAILKYKKSLYIPFQHILKVHILN